MQEQIGVYKALDKIGEGGMGEVYRGLDTMLEREVAIKQLRTEFAGNSDIVERFRTEAVTLAKLNHPNIVTLYSFLREPTGLYMVLEFVRGETLDQMIRRRGALPWSEAVALTIQALQGLEHAHQTQVIHRDLKPANIILTSAGVLKLMDFGIARILNSARQTRIGHLIGTLQYMSPEQVKGGEGDGRSDLYSLAIVLYELLAGRVPFDGDTDYDLIKAQVENQPPALASFGVVVPAALVKVMGRALAKTPAERFQSASEFAQALQGVLSQADVPSGPSNVTDGSVPKPTGEFANGAALTAAKAPHPALGFIKNNPIVAAAVVMVVVGVALLFAARGDRTGKDANLQAESKEVAIPSKPVRSDGPSTSLALPEGTKVILPPPEELPREPGKATAPVKTAAPLPQPPPPAPPRQPVQVTRPVAPPPVENYPPPERPRRVYTPPPAPAENYPAQIPERRRPVYTPPSAQEGSGSGSWGNAPVRK